MWLKEQSGLERGMLTEGTERTGERNVDWRNRADCRAECWLKEQGGLETLLLTEGTERNGERNVDWRNRAECWLKEQSGLQSVILTEGTERTGERNVDWRNRADWRAECWLKEQSGLESGMLTEGTELEIRQQENTAVSSTRNCCLPTKNLNYVILMQCHATDCFWRSQQVLRHSRTSKHFI